MYKNKIIIFLVFLTLMAVDSISVSYAEPSASQNVEEFYRPISHRDLYTRLPPRLEDTTLGGDNSLDFFSESSDCPDTIMIGSVDSETDVFGSVDIDVYIDSDISIRCGR